MDKNILKALYVILLSLGLGFVFNFLFFEKEIGISVFIFFGLLLAAVYFFGQNEQPHAKKTWWISLLVLFFSLMPALRADEFLNFLNICAVLGLLLVLAHEFVGTPAFLMKLKDYGVLLVIVPFKMLARAFSTISLFSQIHSNVKNRDVWVRVIKGVVMAIPILLVFGILFSKADLAFSQFVKNIIDIQISVRTMQYLVLLVFAFGCALSFLSYIFFPKPSAAPLSAPQPGNEAEAGKSTEMMVFLTIISALFLLFIGFQITYLFGGETNIVNAGFTYAEYARRGFWELLAVAFLSLLVLLASEKYANAETKKDSKFTVPALVLVAEVIIVIVSAFKRLSLYIDTYSMTTLRFYVAGFIILLFALFVLLAVKFIKSKQENFFAFGTLLLVTAFLVIVNILNPDAFIVRSNIERYNKTGKVDIMYVGDLSADAVPGKIELYQKLQGEDKATMGDILKSQKSNLLERTKNWQSTNLPRSRALNLIQELEK